MYLVINTSTFLVNDVIQLQKNSGKRIKVFVSTDLSISELQTRLTDTTFKKIFLNNNEQDNDLSDYRLMDICHNEYGYVFTLTNETKEDYYYNINEIFSIYESMDRLLTKLKNKEYPDTYDNNLQKLNHRSHDYFEINRYGGYTMLSREWMDLLIEFLNGKSVLDIGTGIGALSNYLKQNGINITPIDDYSWNRFDWESNNLLWNDDIKHISYEDFINNSELDFDYVMMAYPTNDGMAKKVYDMIKNKNDQLPIIYIGPFNAEYTKDDFSDSVSVLNNESIDKINASFNYWTAHPFLKDSTIKLVI